MLAVGGSPFDAGLWNGRGFQNFTYLEGAITMNASSVGHATLCLTALVGSSAALAKDPALQFTITAASKADISVGAVPAKSVHGIIDHAVRELSTEQRNALTKRSALHAEFDVYVCPEGAKAAVCSPVL
jgi:hypothetical protein